MPMIDSTAPTGSSAASSGSREVGHEELTRDERDHDDRHVDEEDEPYQKWPSRKPLATGPIAPAAPVTLAQIAIAFGRSCGGKTLMMIDSVDGMINAPATPMTARHAISCHIAVDMRREPGADEEQHQPELQRALAPVPVAERAGREQQPGEHERVDGDDPLQLRLGRVQLARQRRDRDVEARVADEDDQQAQAEHRERPPPPVVQRLVVESSATVVVVTGCGAFGRRRSGSGFRMASYSGSMLPIATSSRIARNRELPIDRSRPPGRCAPTPGATGSGCWPRPRTCSPRWACRRRSRRSPAGPGSAWARSAATSRPSRRWSRPCSRRCTSRCCSDAAPRAGAARSRRGVRARSSSRCPEFQARHRALAEQMATEIDLPASAQSVRDALRGRDRRARRRARRTRARSAPTSVRPTSRCSSPASRTPPRSPAICSPCCASVTSHHPRRPAPAEASHTARPAARLRAAAAAQEAKAAVTRDRDVATALTADPGQHARSPALDHARDRHHLGVHRRARQHRAQRRDPDDPARLPHHAAERWSGSITGYALTFATLLIIGGRLGDIYGHRRMFIIGAALFGVGSLLASISHSVGMIILGEAIIEGIGASLMLPATLAILSTTFHGPRAGHRVRGVGRDRGRRGRVRAGGRRLPHRLLLVAVGVPHQRDDRAARDHRRAGVHAARASARRGASRSTCSAPR